MMCVLGSHVSYTVKNTEPSLRRLSYVTSHTHHQAPSLTPVNQPHHPLPSLTSRYWPTQKACMESRVSSNCRAASRATTGSSPAN